MTLPLLSLTAPSQLFSPAVVCLFFPHVLLPSTHLCSFSFHTPHVQGQLNPNNRSFGIQTQTPCRTRNSLSPSANNADRATNAGEFVDVVGIGSRNKAVLQFCFNSPLLSPALRFWNVVGVDSSNVQLQEIFSDQDTAPRIVEAPSVLQSCSKALIIIGTNWHPSEELQLCISWVRVSSCNITGRYQNVKNLWKRVHEDYTKNWRGIDEDPQAPIRTQSSMESHFPRLKSMLKKWNTCYNKAKNRASSGTNLVDEMTQAQFLYFKSMKKTFDKWDCWEAVKMHDHFKEVIDTPTPFDWNFPVSPEIHTDSPIDLVDGEEFMTPRSKQHTPHPPSPVRPMGVKAAKEAKKKGKKVHTKKRIRP